MLGLTRLSLARPDVFQEFLLRHCIVGFDIVRSNTCCCTDKLTYDPVCHRALRNRLCKVNHRFAKPRGSFFQIVDGLCVGLLSDKRRFIIIPKEVVTMSHVFGFRYSLVICHSSFDINSSFVVRISSLRRLLRRAPATPPQRKSKIVVDYFCEYCDKTRHCYPNTYENKQTLLSIYPY